MPNKKRLLIFSNNPICLGNSNGRTLFGLISNFKNFEITNLYVHDGAGLLPNISYKRISDKMVLKTILTKRALLPIEPLELPSKESNKKSKIGIKKSPFSLLMRGWFWSSKRFEKKFINLIKKIKPDAFLFQVGDFHSFNNLCCSVKKELGIPLIIYDTEDYYFKDWNFIKGSFNKGYLFKKYKNKYNRSFEYLMSKTDRAVFLTEDLERIHKEKFPFLITEHIYNSHISTLPKLKKQDGLILYSGNLSVGRADSIIQIADTIHCIDNELKLTVCSQTRDEGILKKIQANPNIEFLGNVSYDRNIELLVQSSLIIHVESFDPFYIKDSVHAFSTKVPDCLFTQNSFLVIAPKTSSVFNYFRNNQCGYCCGSLDELKEILSTIIRNRFENSYKNAASSVSDKNHDPLINSNKMQRIVEEVI